MVDANTMEKETVRLYDKQPYETEFETKVVSCEEAARDGKRVYQTVLAETLFFPEEGGQSPDQGTIDGIPVLDVQIARGIITHTLEAPLDPGSVVKGCVDWRHRFFNMQQHTGEHIFSGIVHRRFGLDNVGFHLSDSVVTMDYNGMLSEEQLSEVEWETNRAIAENLPVRVFFPDEEEEKRLDYRSKKEVEGALRLVEIPGYDLCACCAPHVKRTGEIGMLKVMQFQHYKGGVRVSILCGFRALAAFREKAAVVSDLTHLLSAGQDMLSDSVKRLLQEREELKNKLAEERWKTLETHLEQLAAETGSGKPRLLFEGELDEILMRRAVNQMTDQGPGICGVFGAGKDGGFRFVLGSADEDCRAVDALLREKLGAKGGGSQRMIQGNLQASEAKIREVLSEY